jgi:hypothetical protein
MEQMIKSAVDRTSKIIMYCLARNFLVLPIFVPNVGPTIRASVTRRVFINFSSSFSSFEAVQSLPGFGFLASHDPFESPSYRQIKRSFNCDIPSHPSSYLSL